jgi:hypothetical protein|tara:strand:- start:59 stop:574 length:516 start_codon:yes stop_codon:yes gene_type:complete
MDDTEIIEGTLPFRTQISPELRVGLDGILGEDQSMRDLYVECGIGMLFNLMRYYVMGPQTRRERPHLFLYEHPEIANSGQILNIPPAPPGHPVSDVEANLPSRSQSRLAELVSYYGSSPEAILRSAIFTVVNHANLIGEGYKLYRINPNKSASKLEYEFILPFGIMQTPAA